MAEEPQQMHEEENEQPFIPPHYMLILALVGLLVAVGVVFTQPTFTVIGWGGLGITLLSLVAWVLMAPDQARGVLTGRTMRFGGMSMIVTLVVLIALIATYVAVRGLNARVDLTQTDTYSLSDESRQAISTMSADPTVPKIKMYAFYDATLAGQHDRDQLLFEDYGRTSSGKVEFEFVDPDRNPALANQMKVTRAGQIYVTRLDENGQPDIENGTLVNFVNQDDLTNAVLKVAAAGDFQAYFLQVDGGLTLTTSSSDGMGTLNSLLTDRLDWKTQQVGLFQFTSPAGGIKLNDPNVDGEVVVIPGGDKQLSDDETKILTDYLDKGGKLIILAGPDSGTDQTSTAVTPALNDYLWAKFGLRFNDDVVIDPVQAWQTPLIPVSTDFSLDHTITRSFPSRTGLAFELPHSIQVADTMPEGVTGRWLARSTADAYTKTDYQAVVNGQYDRVPDDPAGPFALAAVAENSSTGAKVVLFGSTSIAMNNYAPIASLVNLDAIFNSLVWTTGFDTFFTQINIQSAQRPQDSPLFVDQTTGGMISLVTILLLPFGVLAAGLLVWWNNREPAR